MWVSMQNKLAATEAHEDPCKRLLIYMQHLQQDLQEEVQTIWTHEGPLRKQSPSVKYTCIIMQLCIKHTSSYTLGDTWTSTSVGVTFVKKGSVPTYTYKLTIIFTLATNPISVTCGKEFLYRWNLWKHQEAVIQIKMHSASNVKFAATASLPGTRRHLTWIHTQGRIASSVMCMRVAYIIHSH
jgi:hypothetical protein